jgi:Flp pilus assembly protein TadG
MQTINGRLRCRRGAVLVFVALSMTVLMLMVAFVVDIGRYQAMLSELQRTADAAALAGADALARAHNGTYTDSAAAIASINTVEGRAATMSYAFGHWTGTALVATTIDTADAVRATATQSGTKFLWGITGGASGAFTLSRSATAWAGGSIRSSTCVKPWIVPYGAMLYVIGHNTSDLSYNLTEADVRQLEINGPTHPIALRDGSGQINQPGGTTINVPGSFGSVYLPPHNRGGTQHGPADYQEQISDQSCNSSPADTSSADTVAIGDQLQSIPGNKANDTRAGMRELCNVSGGGQSFSCTPPVPVTVAIYATSTGSGNNALFTVKYLGQFMATGYDHPGTVLGYFTRFTGGGGFSPFAGPIHRLALVK